MTRMRALLLVAGVAAGVVAGCGGDDDDSSGDTASIAGTANTAGTAGTASIAGTDVEVSADAQAYVDAMIESFDSSDPDELQIDREQAQCLAPRWVEAIGTDRLAEAGIEPEDFAAEGDVDFSNAGLTEDDGNALYDAFEACDIDIRGVFVDSLAADQDLSEEDTACLSDAIDDDLLRRIMVTTLVEGEDALNQDQELLGDVLGAFSECPGAVPTSQD